MLNNLTEVIFETEQLENVFLNLRPKNQTPKFKFQVLFLIQVRTLNAFNFHLGFGI